MLCSLRRFVFAWVTLAAITLGSGLVRATAAEKITAQPATFIVVRHGEKESGGGDVPLSAAGRARAEALARTLGAAGVQHIFTSDVRRTQETAAPLAKQLGVSAQPMKAVPNDALVAALNQLPAGVVALVVQHSNTVGPLLTKLGAARNVAIAEHEFDRMFVLTRDPQGSCSLVELRYGPANPPPSPAAKH